MTTENSSQVELPKNFLQKGTRSEHSKNDFQIHVTNSITPSRDFISSRDNSMLKLVIVVSKLLERSPLNSPCFYLLNSNLALFGTRNSLRTQQKWSLRSMALRLPLIALPNGAPDDGYSARRMANCCIKRCSSTSWWHHLSTRVLAVIRRVVWARVHQINKFLRHEIN